MTTTTALTPHQIDTIWRQPIRATYILPVVGTAIPVTVTGYPRDGKVAITISAEDSRMTKDGQPVAVDLVVSTRSVVL